MWLYFPYKAGDTVEIASMGTKFPIEQLYKNVRLEFIYLKRKAATITKALS